MNAAHVMFSLMSRPSNRNLKEDNQKVNFVYPNSTMCDVLDQMILLEYLIIS